MLKLLLIIPFFISCSIKQPEVSNTAIVIFKTPKIKFYDKGFISQYKDYVHLQVLNLGKVVLDLQIYKDKICKGILQCLDSREFNTQYLSSKYDDDFMFELFKKKNIYFKDKQNNILIKIKKD